MKWTFSVVYINELKSYISGDNPKDIVKQEGHIQMSVEEDSLEDAAYSIKDTLALDNKTLKSLMLLNIEI
jgi:hypothetical protein